jgi:hypothetical protein
MPRPVRVRESGLVVPLTLVAALVIAACGGSTSPAPSGPGSSSGASAASSPVASASPVGEPSAAPSTAASAAASTAAGGGGEACDLLSTDEVAGAMGETVSRADSLPGEPSYCSYFDGSDRILVATSYTRQASDFVFDAFAGEEGAIELDGIGDRAVWSPSTESVYVRKGQAMFGVAAGRGSAGPEARQADGTELATIAAPRM